MAEETALILLRDVISANNSYLEVLLRESFTVVCINENSGKTRVLPFKALYTNNSLFWIRKGEWTYFLRETDLASLDAKLQCPNAVPSELSAPALEVIEAPAAPEQSPPPLESETDEGGSPEETSFGHNYSEILSMTVNERTQVIDEAAKRLDSLAAQRPRQRKAAVEALIESTRSAALINRATLLGAMQLADGEAKKHTQSTVNSTQEMVKSTTQLITRSIFSDDLMNTLVAKSNGTVIQHMTRVFLTGLAFLSYYNELLTTTSYINKLRISFERQYRDFYRFLLPHLNPEEVVLERVFIKGMKAIAEEDFLNWATGFLIHDIGKAAAVEYHEGEAAYNRDIVIEHVKIGYNSVMNKTNYPRDAGLITGYHHEYYGDPGGYGYFRASLGQHKKTYPWAKQNHCITYELNPILSYDALAFFPVKLLEIIDVYDSITDPNRKYRKAMTPEEALSMMREEFIHKHHKIDIILFDIFADFVRKRVLASAKS